SLKDERGLRAAMKGVDVVYHLVGAERLGSKADLGGVDIDGSKMICAAAVEAGVEKLIYLSHLGADRYSAYPVLKAKAISESFVVQSGINYTIFRSAIAFGEKDQFTIPLANLLKMSPGFFLMPGNGSTLIQPIWIEDLVTCLALAMDEPATYNQLYSIGGAEYISFRETVETIEKLIHVRRRLLSISPAYLRIIALLIEQVYHRFPVSIFWVDYLATDRTCPLDTLPRLFGLMPARFSQHLDYLKPVDNNRQRRSF
ncbi:MAG TPA: NmrA family NAD(P)-binding protein, partial [Anaerolineaceae bacterium]|nr:NmrA family NAD(P)-binding protein [Anaerolineaceae bacterium]